MSHLRRFHAACMGCGIFATTVFAASSDMGLIEAIKVGDNAAVSKLIEQRADVHATEADGSTALHWAVRRDDVETVALLLNNGLNVQAMNRYGVTPLSLACINGNAAVVELLLKNGADPNAALPGGETALMTASRTGNVDVVRALIESGADVAFAEPRQGQTALMWAAAEGNTAVVQELTARGADIHARTKAGFTPLLFAVREGRIETVQALLEAGADVNETWQGEEAADVDGISAMVLAVANGHYELASRMLDAGADPNASAQGWTALHQISWVRKAGETSDLPAPQGSGNVSSLDFVKKLVAHGANVNARMTRQGNVGRTYLNMIGATPFLMAARTADAPLMRLLAELGADPLLPNADGTTPLLVAAGVGTYFGTEDPVVEQEVFEAIKVAVELGNDVNAVDMNGETVMHGAAYKHVPLAVQYLLEKGAKLEVWNRKNETGWSPLRIADGVMIGNNINSSAAMSAELRRVMSAAGVSTVVEPDIVRPGH